MLRNIFRGNLIQVVAVVVTFLYASPIPVAGNLVTNGSFESNGGVGQINGTTTLAGWTVGPVIVTSNTSGGTLPFSFVVDNTADSAGFSSVNSPPNIFVWGPANGQNNGFTGSPDGGDFFGSDSGYATATLSQTINGLNVGDTYTLTFQWAASQFTDATAATTQDWQVSLGGTTVTTTPFNLPGQGFSGWMSYSNTFIATSASEVLSFLAQSGGANALPPFALLDGVSLTDTTTSPTSPTGAETPEPSTFISLGLGMIGICAAGVIRRRRKSA